MHEFPRLDRLSVPAGLNIQSFLRFTLLLFYLFYYYLVILGGDLFSVGGKEFTTVGSLIILVYSCCFCAFKVASCPVHLRRQIGIRKC